MIILASASPRRRELLSLLGLPFLVSPPDIDEDVVAETGRPARLARRLAIAKARAEARSHPDALILAADTVVAHHGVFLGKPRDAAEAEAMLRQLRGLSHRVTTALAVLPPGRRWPYVDHALTRVTMRDYGDAEIAASIARGDPFDKAGAYAIQDKRLRPVESYEGCYCNVVGLPLWIVLRLLSRAGVEVAHITPERLLSQCQACLLAL